MNDCLTRGFVEYLLYFKNDGDYLVDVKFSGKNGWRIATQKTTLSEVTALIEFLSEQSSATMLFDDCFGLLKEVRIDPKTRKVAIIVDLAVNSDSSN